MSKNLDLVKIQLDLYNHNVEMEKKYHFSPTILV